MALRTLLELLDQQPHLQHIELSQVIDFIRLSSLLKRDIFLAQPARQDPENPPDVIPPSVAAFLSGAVKLSIQDVMDLWVILKAQVWLSDPEDNQSKRDEAAFKTHGWHLGITSVTVYPPTTTCTNWECEEIGSVLKRAEQRQVLVYSLADGACPAWSVHLSCPHCQTNYHNNFSVHDDLRTYYAGIPSLIQIGEHQFAELKLVNMWISSMLLGWFSATNCAKLYDIALSDRTSLEAGGWQFGLKLTPNHIWDAFVIKTLLEDRQRNWTQLQVEHGGDQNMRFQEAMAERNERIILLGQDEVPHYCDRCMRVWEDDEGNLHRTWVIASDGNNMGHPCCGEFCCTEPVQSTRGRRHFCATHDHLHSICAIIGCDGPIVKGTKACEDPAHQEMGRLNAARGTAAFTLKHRLQRQKLRNTLASAPPIEGSTTAANVIDLDDDEIQELIEWFDIDEDGHVDRHEGKNLWSVGVVDDDGMDPCDPKSEDGNRKIKAIFHRRRTHNEQTLVRPCGVIFGRATFFGAEAVSNVLLFVKNTFSVPGAHKPDHFIYDTNCDAKQQVMKEPRDTWWDSVGMSVDVWHFLNKHKVSHEFCQKYCNPADFPELLNEDGKTWFFNTSIAEQVNVWLGGYHAIVREMLPVKYNFFLDEMIRLRNITTVAQLERDGHRPRHAPPPE
ncbi:hypothetical protein B0H15DRAFT_948600 [Mycena belliarum]|uniref:CxC5 like cysteine cluster associated with KDZ domain-containing protein n=1 Tax=Mycena belliarum TaxID=1033014 RepID=A0AAD6U846_9AGAR|nr:hypothetical protein B0H15DRAFT_948600 [Mycena belliae]